MTVEASIDGLDLLRAINNTQARGREGARVDPLRAAQEAGAAGHQHRHVAEPPGIHPGRIRSPHAPTPSRRPSVAPSSADGR